MGNKIVETINLEFDEMVTSIKIHKQTLDKINSLIILYLKEKRGLINIAEIEKNKLKICLDELILAQKNNEEIESIELLTLASTANLSSLILRLNNFIKNRGDIWKLQKRKLNGKVYYKLIPN